VIIEALRQDLIPQVRQLMELGAPYIRVRTDSDYWLYAHLFSSTCPVALIDGRVAAVVTAFRSQEPTLGRSSDWRFRHDRRC
jgi:hypothetical protein